MRYSREEVYKAIDGERDYQDKLVISNGYNTVKTVGEYLSCIRVYLRKAEDDWSKESDSGSNRPSLAQIRKIAALAVSCMEEQGVIYR